MPADRSSLYFVLQPPAAAPASATPPLLVLLHGYGSHEQDLMGLVPQLDPRLLVASARAPQALDMGGFAWFPVEFTPFGLSLRYEEAEAARDQVVALVRALQQEHEIAPERTFLLGFSQGASMALSAALQHPELVAGVVSLSGLYAKQMVPDQGPEKLRGLPVLMTHGRHDPLILIRQARESRELLAALPVDLTYREYDMGHEIDGECLTDLRAWLAERLDAAPPS
jgi:phospholipase/carboxylesterase